MPLIPSLAVSRRNPHLLETSGGQPFLMMGDTAWEMFHRLRLDEIEHYFRVRSEQGFNMIWANLVPEFDGVLTPNRYGETPFEGVDPRLPSEKYFLFVDQVVEMAERAGLYLGLLPAWGDKLTAPWGAGPRIFRNDNLEEAGFYGEWLGSRYQGATNILWVLGGDRPAKLVGPADEFPKRNAVEAGLDPDSDWTPIWRTMAQGIKKGGAQQLMTYHPQGGTWSTSCFLHDEAWLDLNAIQSGHGGGHDVPVWESVTRDYALQSIKPTFDAEPNYEDHPVNPWPVWDPASGFFDDYDVRKQVYRSIFAGGCGVIYGHHCVWQFAGPEYEPVLEVLFDWQTALLRPGADQLRHLAWLLQSVQWIDMVPAQSRILSEVGVGGSHARAMGNELQTVIYVPDSRSIEVDLKWAHPWPVEVKEFNPMSGAVFSSGLVVSGDRAMVSPFQSGPDRVILLEAKQA